MLSILSNRKLLFPLRNNIILKNSMSSTKIKFNNKLNYNIKYLGESLGSIIKEHDINVYKNIEKLRTLSKEWRLLSKESNDNISKNSFDMMVKEVKDYDVNMLNGVSRGFTHFLSLSNSAENQHRTRRLRERLLTSNQALPNRIDSCNGTIANLIKKGISSDEISSVLKSQSVEIVLTAHPTEVNRKTMLEKHQRINKLLDDADHLDVNEYEKRQINKGIKAEISAIWESDELMRKKPTPVDEAKSGLRIVDNILWKSVPSYLRKLDDVIKQKLGKSLPLNFSPIKIASWMGGDRDGNPNVTPEITKKVLILSRITAAKLLKKDISVLHSQLSLKSGSKELMSKVGNNIKEPYRVVLQSLDKALVDTIIWGECELNNLPTKVLPLLKTSEVIDPLLLLHKSLIDTGNIEIADGDLIDTIRRLYAFGLTLLPLDIRQESTRHSEAIDAITNYLGIGSYISWDENKRREWLLKELSSKRPLLPSRKCDLVELGFSATVIDTLKTFDLIASSGPGSLGAYVISQCQQSSDILAVMLLQQDAGVISPIRVVPLFETLDDLERSSKTIEALFSMDLYRERIGKSQEIMVGYSDSSKDAGRLASSWALYNCQQQIVNIGKKYSIDLTFFHGNFIF
jgi:phosphoenolpyruvate carboxylase